VGGVGINLAIQDAVAAANVLFKPLRAYSDEIATESDAKRHAFRRKSAVREVGAKRRWDFVHNLRGLVFASQVIISWFF
jgi:2-polyprenyl-6-methoxyphenol hydroxylase-like FAD-dependent oxidoreductase